MATPTAIDQLDPNVKLILTILCDPIVMGVNRVLRGKLIPGVVWIVTGGIFGIGWLYDIYTMITKKDITFLS